MSCRPIAVVAILTLAAASCSDGSLIVTRTDKGGAWYETWDDETGDAGAMDPGQPPDDWPRPDAGIDQGHDLATDQGTEPDPRPDPADPGKDDVPAPPEGTVALLTNQEYLPALLAAVNAAGSSVLVAHLEFLDGYLTDNVHNALVAAAGRGVKVRVLLDDKPDDNPGRVAAMKAAGVDARLDGVDRTLHTKLVVVDRSVALVGSTNFSVSSLKYNNEANFRLADPEVAEALADYADALWASDSGPKTITGAAIGGVRLIGDGQYADRVLPIITGATSRIRLIMYQLDLGNADAADLADAIAGAAKAGVDVKVVLELSDFADDVNADNQDAKAMLEAAGVDVRMDTLATTTHAKMLVVDDTVVVYSGNWVYAGMVRNHEAGAIISDPKIASEAVSYFDQVWAASN